MLKKDIKLTYLKKATKFLDKNQSILTEEQVDALVIKFIKKKCNHSPLDKYK